jgi:hypothetical protein
MRIQRKNLQDFCKKYEVKNSCCISDKTLLDYTLLKRDFDIEEVTIVETRDFKSYIMIVSTPYSLVLEDDFVCYLDELELMPEVEFIKK